MRQVEQDGQHQQPGDSRTSRQSWNLLRHPGGNRRSPGLRVSWPRIPISGNVGGIDRRTPRGASSPEDCGYRPRNAGLRVVCTTRRRRRGGPGDGCVEGPGRDADCRLHRVRYAGAVRSPPWHHRGPQLRRIPRIGGCPGVESRGRPARHRPPGPDNHAVGSVGRLHGRHRGTAGRSAAGIADHRRRSVYRERQRAEPIRDRRSPTAGRLRHRAVETRRLHNDHAQGAAPLPYPADGARARAVSGIPEQCLLPRRNRPRRQYRHQQADDPRPRISRESCRPDDDARSLASDSRRGSRNPTAGRLRGGAAADDYPTEPQEPPRRRSDLSCLRCDPALGGRYPARSRGSSRLPGMPGRPSAAAGHALAETRDALGV